MQQLTDRAFHQIIPRMDRFFFGKERYQFCESRSSLQHIDSPSQKTKLYHYLLPSGVDIFQGNQ